MFLSHVLPLMLAVVSTPPTDPHIVWSPGNVCLEANAATVTENTTYFKTAFTGTSLALGIDVGVYRQNAVAAWQWGQWVVSVDGGAPTPIKVADPGSGNTATVNLAQGLAPGRHEIQAWFDLRDETDTYAPKDAQTIRSFILDDGASLDSPTGFYAARPDAMMIMGDSITKGYKSADPNGASDSSNYPLATFAATLGQALNCEYGIVGKSGQGWAGNANAWNEVFPKAFGNYFRGQPRIWPKGLKYLVVAEGTNDGANITSTVQQWLPQGRAAVGPDTWIILVAPFNGSHLNELNQATAAYLASSADRKVVVVNPAAVLPLSTKGNFFTVDGTHPQPLLHPLFGAIVAVEIAQSTGTADAASH